jgi:phage FluMu gp28-like protein
MRWSRGSAPRPCKQIRASLDLESFDQEYGLTFVDAAVAFIPWELIQASTRDADELPVVRSRPVTKDEIDVDGALADLGHLTITGPLTAGYDVGRRRNASELIVLEQVGTRYRERLHVTLPQTDFELQEDLLLALLKRRPDLRTVCASTSRAWGCSSPRRSSSVTRPAPRASRSRRRPRA